MSRIAFVALALGFIAGLSGAGTAQQPTRTATRARPRASQRATRPPRVPRAPRVAAPAPIVIAYQRFVLKNGLTLLVHEDHKAPIVAVNIWYHVGSKNERPGRTGFAHLFEHLMFKGSEDFNDHHFQPVEGIGATDQKRTTNYEPTNR